MLRNSYARQYFPEITDARSGNCRGTKTRKVESGGRVELPYADLQSAT